MVSDVQFNSVLPFVNFVLQLLDASFDDLIVFGAFEAEIVFNLHKLSFKPLLELIMTFQKVLGLLPQHRVIVRTDISHELIGLIQVLVQILVLGVFDVYLLVQVGYEVDLVCKVVVKPFKTYGTILTLLVLQNSFQFLRLFRKFILIKPYSHFTLISQLFDALVQFFDLLLRAADFFIFALNARLQKLNVGVLG